MSTDKVGIRIKKFRERQNLSIAELAERSQLSAEFIRAMEEDNVYPSLGPLIKVARGLGQKLGTFLDDQVSKDPLIVKLSEREEEITMLKGKDKPAEMKYYSLGKGKQDRHMEPFFIEIFPESEDEKKLSSHEGEELIIVQKGEVELLYGKEKFKLKAGDSMYYNSIVPHYVGLAGKEKAEIYAVIYVPQ
jgi:transcriptional regulator with XRE-family HTH domain